MAVKEYTFEEICREIKEGHFAPVYVLMGEEPYFIDAIEELLIRHVLNDTERDFNQLIFYGKDSNALDIMNTARRVPMMAKYQLVIVKEAQSLNKIELLSHYVKSPVRSTVLVICHKYKKIDGRKSILVETKKNGILFESKKIYENKMAGFIVSFMKQRAMDIDWKSAQMLTDHIGNNIGRLAKEADKLKIILGENASTHITPEIIEKNIGISKDYNSFELVSAIASKDVLKANRIAGYFNKNEKANAEQKVLSVLFNYFSNLMICLYSKDKTERGVMQTLNLQWNFQAKDYLSGLRNYTAMKVFEVIHEIRLADAKTKGFENSSATTIGDIYKELLYKMMH
ncbi:MAG: DNA polymerase III subunit delta [Tannerella sp.]|jgi:DNA polymerase-3 subunit delta|nr:DNA polymerase III subunit delta [Tannerella sp.]